MTETATRPATPTGPEARADEKPAAKAGVSPRHTACICPVCGGEAGYDLAPNPGPPPGGEHAPPPPQPPEIQTPPPEVPEPGGQWYLVLCLGGVHRTLWPEARLAELGPPDPPVEEGGAVRSHAPAPGGNKLFARDIPAPDPRLPAGEGRARKPPDPAPAPAPAPHPDHDRGHGHGHGHDKAHDKK
jgi:hypothetical protein